MKSIRRSVRHKLCHASRVSTVSLIELKHTVRSSGRLRRADQCGTEATDSTDPITMEQNLKIRTDAAYVQTRAHRRILELDRRRNRKHVEFQLGVLVCIWRVPKGKKELSCSSTKERREAGSNCLVCAHHEFVSRSTSDLRRHETCFFTRYIQQTWCPLNVSSFCEMDKFLMAFGQTWLDQDGPPAEAVERPDGNEFNDEGPGEQVPRKRTRIKSKATDTAPQIESDEDVFAIQEEQDHESWRPFHLQHKL